MSHPSRIDYEKDVMPIFRAKCYDCHSEKSKKVKGGLRLDDPEGFFKRFAKNDVVIPGDWDASYFVTITKPRDEKHAMPPEDKGDPLTPAEIMTVAKWIHEGANIGREKGDKGSKEMDPKKILKFKDGVLVLDQGKDEAPADPPPATPQEWTNRNGMKIIATFKGLKDGKAHLVLENGRDVSYPSISSPTKPKPRSGSWITGSNSERKNPATPHDGARSPPGSEP